MAVSTPLDHPEVHRSFTPTVTSARAARNWTEPVLAAWGVGHRRADVVLVVSELVANAIRHGEGQVHVCLRRQAGGLCIAVSDQGEADDIAAQRPDRRQASGRGLAIVEHMVTEWGVHARAGGGKTVWATLPVEPPSP